MERTLALVDGLAGFSFGRAGFAGARNKLGFTPVLHLDTSPKLVQFIKLADAAAGTGAEHVRAPRLAIEGEERQRILTIVHEVLATRPNCPNVGAPAVQEAH